MRRISRELAPLQIIEPPGGYGDGPVYLRVHKNAARTWRMYGMGLSVVKYDQRLTADPHHDYIPAINTHSAFAYRMWLRDVGVRDEQLSVVRIARRAG